MPHPCAEPLATLTDVARHFFGPHRGWFGTGRSRIRAVDGISLTIGTGEAVGLVGESGCGKSTLGRLVQGLDRPTGGRITVAGRVVGASAGWDRQAHARTVQTIYQSPADALDPRVLVGRQIREPLDIHKIGTPAERTARTRDLLAAVDLSPDLAGRLPHQVSGGQAQRVVIARALALRPRLLVCDEPVASLDAPVQRQIVRLLARLRAELGLSYLFISHDLSVVWQLCQRVAIMYLGRIVEEGPTEAIFARPRHPYTQALISAVPRPDPDAPRRLPLLRNEPPSPIDVPRGCRLHTRCPYVQEICRLSEPALRPAAAGHAAACHFIPPDPARAHAARN